MNLVELVIAIVILSLGVLGLAATADSAERAMARGRRASEAVARAQVQLDSLRSQACRGAGEGEVKYVRDSLLQGAVICP